MAATATSSARRAVGAVAAVAGRAAAESSLRAGAPNRVAPERRPTPSSTAPLLRAVAPDERLPRPLRPARERRIIALFATGLILTLGLVANLAIHVQTTQGQFRLDRLQSDATSKEVAYQKLRVEVARLEAPQRVVAEAKRLGMVEPPEVRYLAPNGSTSASAPPDPSLPDGSAGGGAQSWSQVKSHLGGGR